MGGHWAQPLICTTEDDQLSETGCQMGHHKLRCSKQALPTRYPKILTLLLLLIPNPPLVLYALLTTKAKDYRVSVRESWRAVFINHRVTCHITATGDVAAGRDNACLPTEESAATAVYYSATTGDVWLSLSNPRRAVLGVCCCLRCHTCAMPPISHARINHSWLYYWLLVTGLVLARPGRVYRQNFRLI